MAGLPELEQKVAALEAKVSKLEEHDYKHKECMLIMANNNNHTPGSDWAKVMIDYYKDGWD